MGVIHSFETWQEMCSTQKIMVQAKWRALASRTTVVQSTSKRSHCILKGRQLCWSILPTASANLRGIPGHRTRTRRAPTTQGLALCCLSCMPMADCAIHLHCRFPDPGSGQLRSPYKSESQVIGRQLQKSFVRHRKIKAATTSIHSCTASPGSCTPKSNLGHTEETA